MNSIDLQSDETRRQLSVQEAHVKQSYLVSRVVPFVTRQFASRLGRLDASVQPLIDDIRAREYSGV